MSTDLLSIAIPAALAAGGVVFTAIVNRRKNEGDGRLQFITVLQAERITADARADKAEQQRDRAESRARRFEKLAWQYHQMLMRSGLDPIPEWPTDETAKVTT